MNLVIILLIAFCAALPGTSASLISYEEALQKHHVALNRSALIEALQNPDAEVRWLVTAKLLMNDHALETAPAIRDAVARENDPIARINVAPSLASVADDRGYATLPKSLRRSMVLRLTQERAQKVLGGPLVNGTDRQLVWQASQWDRQAHPELPPQAAVQGRLLVCENPSRPKELLYLFTTLDLAAEEVLSIYDPASPPKQNTSILFDPYFMLNRFEKPREATCPHTANPCWSLAIVNLPPTTVKHPWGTSALGHALLLEQPSSTTPPSADDGQMQQGPSPQ